jgi:hypothetical protein
VRFQLGHKLRAVIGMNGAMRPNTLLLMMRRSGGFPSSTAEVLRRFTHCVPQHQRSKFAVMLTIRVRLNAPSASRI